MYFSKNKYFSIHAVLTLVLATDLQIIDKNIILVKESLIPIFTLETALQINNNLLIY